MSTKLIKVIGMVASVGGAVASLVGHWADGKQQDAKIAEQVAKAVAKATGKES